MPVPEIPADLPEPFAGALTETLTRLRADPQVEAVFLGGSLAQGQPDPHSDLDLVVIKGEAMEVVERYTRYVQEVQVQVIAGPCAQFDAWLERDRPSGTVVRQLAGGHLLFDRDKVGACYQKQAREVVEQGLAPMNRPQIRARRFMLTELLDDVADRSRDAAQCRWLMCTGLALVVETAFLWQQQWTPKAKKAMAEMEVLDPELAQLCRRFLEEADLDGQRAAFESLVTYVLAPLGGELREAWTRPPEPVSRGSR